MAGIQKLCSKDWAPKGFCHATPKEAVEKDDVPVIQKQDVAGNCWKSLSKNQKRMILIISIIGALILAGGLCWGLGIRHYNPSATLAGQILVQTSLIVTIPLIFSAVCSCVDKASE
jgi:hypothetical protein